MKSTSTTNITRLTPTGRGAVAVLSLDGVDAMRIVERRFVSVGKSDWKTASSISPVFGLFRIGNSNACEEVVLFRPSENQIEIQTHGGEIIVAVIEQTLVEDEAILCPQNENRSEQDEILAMLPAAKTERLAKIVLDQYHANFDTEIEELRTLLADPDSEIRSNGIKRLNRIRENAQLGRRLFEPFRVVLTGPVNAGKSSLLNAIIGFDRAIVDAVAGTTRDAVGVDAVLDGWPITLIDTAGIRETSDPLERMGIAKAAEILGSADIVLKIVDLSSRPFSQPQLEADNVITVLNKCDLVDSSEFDSVASAVRTIATENVGIRELCETIVRRRIPNPPRLGEIVPLTPRQITDVETIYHSTALRQP